MAGWLRRLQVAVFLLTLLLLAPDVMASTRIERLSERGPATLFVGTLFTLASPVGMLSGVVTRGAVAPHACRLGHGLKMVAAGVVLLPAGLLVAPFNLGGVPGGWMDGIVTSFQEDYCSRPLSSFYP